MANRLPKAAAIVAALLAVPLGAGVATAAPTSAPTAAPASGSASSNADSMAHAKALAKAAHQRFTPATTAGSAKSAPSAKAQASAQAAARTARLAGANRYETSVAVSRASYDDTQLLGGTLVVASGTQFPDAVAGGPAAAGIGGPLLLVPPTGTVPAAVITEIKRLGVDAIYIMGSEGAVSAGVEAQLANVVSHVDRIFGANRYETSAFASAFSYTFDESNPDAEPTPPSVVYLASGTTFADSLSGSAAGTIEGAPLILTSPTTLPDVTQFALEDINPVEVRILGSTAAVSANVADQVAQALPSATITRLGGADRYATAAAVAKNLNLPTGGTVMLANGLNFPDALSASTSSAVINAPLLLVKQNCSPAATTAQVNLLAPSLVRAIGSTAVVSNDALARKAC